MGCVFPPCAVGLRHAEAAEAWRHVDGERCHRVRLRRLGVASLVGRRLGVAGPAPGLWKSGPPEGKLRIGRRPRHAGKQLRGRFGHHRAAGPRLESGDQRDLPLAPADLVPRQPEAVGVSQVGAAVVVRQLLRQEDIFLFGSGVVRIVAGPVECVDGERPVDDDRLIAFCGVEEKASAKPAHARPTVLVEHRVGPHRGHADRPFRLRGACEPGRFALQLELGAAAQRTEQKRASSAADGCATAVVQGSVGHDTRDGSSWSTGKRGCIASVRVIS